MKNITELSSLMAKKASRFFNKHSAGEILAEIIRVRLMRINPTIVTQFQSFKAVGKSNVGVIFLSQVAVAA